MTSHQKSILAITLVTASVTCGISFVCFRLPYDLNESLALGSIILSEMIFGGSWIIQTSKNDDVFPVSLGALVPDVIYVMFTLGCTRLTKIGTGFFLLIEAVGFAVFVVVRLLGLIAEHHVKEMSAQDESEQKIERAKTTWR